MSFPRKLFLAGGRAVKLERPGVVGVLNATPDSFSDGGKLDNPDQAKTIVKEMLAAGVSALDVGGESTRPGHESVDVKAEIDRVVPVIKLIRSLDTRIPISIDTQKARVAEAALQNGASFINAVNGLDDPEMAQFARDNQCSIVLMRHRACRHSVTKSVTDQLAAMVKQAVDAGLQKHQLILDPGLGFGDLPTHDFSALPGPSVPANMQLIEDITHYDQGLPVIIGASRKRFVGKLSGVEAAEKRLAGSLVCAILAVQNGAALVRAHDAKETVQALRCLLYKEMETV